MRGYVNNVHRIDHSDDPHGIFWFALEERFGNEICHVDVFVRSLSVVVVQ